MVLTGQQRYECDVPKSFRNRERCARGDAEGVKGEKIKDAETSDNGDEQTRRRVLKMTTVNRLELWPTCRRTRVVLFSILQRKKLPQQRELFPLASWCFGVVALRLLLFVLIKCQEVTRASPQSARGTSRGQIDSSQRRNIRLYESLTFCNLDHVWRGGDQQFFSFKRPRRVSIFTKRAILSSSLAVISFNCTRFSMIFSGASISPS